MASGRTQTLERPLFNEERFDAELALFGKETPSIISATAPEKMSKQTQMAAFLAGETRNPAFNYPKSARFGKEEAIAHRERASSLLEMVKPLGEPHRKVYEDYIAQNLLQADLVLAMHEYNAADNLKDKANAREAFMRLNIELYGEPDRQTYYSLLSEKVSAIAEKSRSAEAENIFAELRDFLPEQAFNPELATNRFRPSAETVAWAHNVVMNLFGNMLKHVPDTDELISAPELRDIFEEIIREEFEDDEWQVVLKDAKAISVGAKLKVVTIPIDRAPVSAAEARRLVVHELGIHMMTAMTGGSTDVAPLEFGLAGYYDTQEGLGKVSEQALEGGFKEAGVDHYITSGLTYFDDADFRRAFEAKWRMKLLEDLEPGAIPTQEQIDTARKIAADGPIVATSRIFRGTNDLPLFKDLSYYNGSVNVWKYLEEIRGDDLQLSLLLAGKISTSREDRRVVLESRTVGQ